MYNQPEVALTKYELEVNSFIKGRSMYVCDTNQGLRLLVPYNASEEKAALLHSLLSEIKNRGFEVEQIYKTIDGTFKSKDDGGVEYILKDCYQGTECRIGNFGDMAAAMELLGRLHMITENIELVADNSETILELYERRYKELIKIRNYVHSKNKKNDFERIFLSVQTEYIDMAKAATEQLSGLWNKLYGEIGSSAAGVWCHGQFNQHNVIHTRQGFRIINFEACCYSTPLLDITSFARKMMEKCDWDINIWNCLMEAYELQRPLAESERELLYYLMKFPEKFWKISNHYYNSNKAWVSGRDIEKLNRVIEQEDKRQSFLEKAFSFKE